MNRYPLWKNLLILGVVRNIYRDQAEELFQGEEQVEVLCPRCGRRWWLAREDYELQFFFNSM